jgi:hypothetical protein
MAREPSTRKEFAEFAGVDIPKSGWFSDWNREMAIRKIADREGWKYYDMHEICCTATANRSIDRAISHGGGPTHRAGPPHVAEKSAEKSSKATCPGTARQPLRNLKTCARICLSPDTVLGKEMIF